MICNYNLKTFAFGVINRFFTADTVIHGQDQLNSMSYGFIYSFVTDTVAAFIS